MTPIPRAAIQLQMSWARCYTAGLPPGIRQRRLDELRSDAYEHFNDPLLAGRPFRLGLDIVQSFIRGLPDDLRWRALHASASLWMLDAALLCLTQVAMCSIIAWAMTAEFVGGQLHAALTLLGAGIGLATGLWCVASLRPGDQSVIEQAVAHPGLRPDQQDSRGELVATPAYLRWSGILLIAAGLFQVVSFGAGAIGNFNYLDRIQEALRDVDDAPVLYGVAVAGSALTTTLLLPLFIHAAFISRGGARVVASLAAALLCLHIAFHLAGLALMGAFLTVARDWSGADPTTAATLEAQGRLLVDLRLILIQPGGLAMLVAGAMVSVVLWKAGLHPKWLMIVGVLHAVSWVPPVSGEFIVTYPLFVLWTIASGLILLRGVAQPSFTAVPQPA